MERKNSPEDVGETLRRLMAMDKSGLPSDGGPGFNRLIFATSPYLLQHATNPVDWYQWGEEAFARAREEGRLLFLSIGYATCHWCHVMEHESFEDREVAEVLNRYFVSIKVDREERPDIDDRFMTVAQMMTGSGGWPLQVIMTPHGKPFFAATYMPKEPRMGMPGVIGLLENIAALWRSQPDLVEKNCATLMDALASLNRPSPGELPGGELLQAACRQLEGMYDEEWGGFGHAPKFPMPHYISFLLRYWRKSGDPAPLGMAEKTIRMMRCGGICDQLGFGFHRYAVDRQWLAPHFEKMLYDQALISLASLEAFQATGNGFYRAVAEEIFSYVLREMRSPEGGFYAAQDADTEGEEGKYYLWTLHEVTEILGESAARVFCRLFDVTERGNFEGVNILHLALSPEEFAEREGVLPELLRADLERWREELLAEREKRIRPFRDEKVLTAWNGLMIAALAKGYAVTGTDCYLEAAASAATFIGTHLQTPEGRLMRSHHLGKGSIPAFLEDYAFYVRGLIELYEATLAPGWLADALRFSREMVRLFRSDGGGLYDTGSDAEEVLLRSLNAYDGVMPSGNSAAADNLLKLGRITGDDSLVREGEAILRAFMGKVVQQPAGYIHLIMAHDFLAGPDVEVTFAGPREGEEMKRMLRAVHRRFIPNLVLRFAGEGEEQRAIDGRATAYVCARGACRPPVTGEEELTELLDGVS